MIQLSSSPAIDFYTYSKGRLEKALEVEVKNRTGCVISVEQQKLQIRKSKYQLFTQMNSREHPYSRRKNVKENPIQYTDQYMLVSIFCACLDPHPDTAANSHMPYHHQYFTSASNSISQFCHDRPSTGSAADEYQVICTRSKMRSKFTRRI